MEIRKVRPVELARVGQLTTEVYVGDGHIAAGDAYVEQLLGTARRARAAEVWVAVDDEASGERILGSVTFCPVGSAYREIGRDGEGEFRMLVVSPEARGRGVGTALVELCIRRSRDLGYAAIRMSTMDRMVAAHRVYERLGFTRAPEDDWSPVPGMKLLAYTVGLGPSDCSPG